MNQLNVSTYTATSTKQLCSSLQWKSIHCWSLNCHFQNDSRGQYLTVTGICCLPLTYFGPQKTSRLGKHHIPGEGKLGKVLDTNQSHHRNRAISNQPCSIVCRHRQSFPKQAKQHFFELVKHTSIVLVSKVGQKDMRGQCAPKCGHTEKSSSSTVTTTLNLKSCCGQMG